MILHLLIIIKKRLTIQNTLYFGFDMCGKMVKSIFVLKTLAAILKITFKYEIFKYLKYNSIHFTIFVFRSTIRTFILFLKPNIYTLFAVKILANTALLWLPSYICTNAATEMILERLRFTVIRWNLNRNILLGLNGKLNCIHKNLIYNHFF